MEVKHINYKNSILKEWVIPILRKEIERLENRVSYDYPSNTENVLPFVVLTINDVPSTYGVDKSELVSLITITIDLLDEYRGDVMDLEYEVTEIMRALGFNRLSSTDVYRNEEYKCFQKTIKFVIKYNALTQDYEKCVV